MSIGLRTDSLFDGVIEIHEARLCESCEIVVKAENCPMCREHTVEHPDIHDGGPYYCVDCAGEFPLEQIRVKPWTHDPHCQCEDGMLITSCLACIKKEEG